MSNSEKRERFGRYLILDHLVDGGMAKICRARFLGEQADKIVAIKMVQPQFSADAAFKQMFMDEIKLAFGLQHPNIVQTYDYGLHNNQLFVAMEYCDGRNLKEYFDKLRKRRFVFPVEISTYIISQVCQGLHYAHTLTDKLSGKKYNIIHRDISPHNIMLTFDGAVKVIDFGIAKAETNSESTQAGTIKGKLSYLAPEYLEGMDLDPRYDEFAVGITLWEMLCSRKLFKANNDLAVLKKIQECYVPAPSEINPHVPKELDQIVLKALSKDRNERYPDLDQLNRALMRFLYANYPEFNATDLAYFAKELFKEEIEEDRKALFEFGKVDIKPYLEDLKREQRGIPSPESRKVPLPPRRKKSSDSAGDAKSTEVNNYLKKRRQKKSEENVTVTEKQRDGRTALRISKGGRTKNIILNTRSQLKRNTTTRSMGRRRGPSFPIIPMLFIASMAAVLILGPKQVLSYLRKIEALQVYIGKNEIVRKIAGVADVPPTPSGEKVLKDRPKFDKSRIKIRLMDLKKHIDKVYINGKEIKPDFLGQIEVPSYLRSTLRIERPGHEHFISIIEKGSNKSFIKVPETAEAGYGYLKTSRNCVRGTLHFTMFGEQREEDLPISNPVGIAFPLKYNRVGKPVPTHFTIGLQKTGEKIKRKVNFTIKNEFDSVDLCSLL